MILREIKILGVEFLVYNMILLVNICNEKLHYFDFVRPIEDILRKNKIEFFVKGYDRINESDLKNAEKIIICGTSLKDNDFLKDKGKFRWIKSFDRPILGICGGMQILGLTYGGRFGQKTEIGFYREDFFNSFLGLAGEQEVYHLHNNFVDFSRCTELDYFAVSKLDILQAFKHKTKPHYGVLFHPEVRQKEMIINFIKL